MRRRKGKDPKEKESLDARDRRLVRGLIAGDRQLIREAFVIVRRNLAKWAKGYARWLLRPEHWEDTCQNVFLLLLRWRSEYREAKQEERRLREDESLWFLSVRALKQVAEKLANEEKWAQLARSLHEHPGQSLAQLELEGEAEGALLAPKPFPRTERLAAAREQLAWIRENAGELAPDDQRVVEAVVDVEEGRVESLGEALGVAEGAARMRKLRLMERLTKAAVTEGNREMARRCGGRKYADGLLLLAIAKPGDAHRMQELGLYRAGQLSTYRRVALEKHLKRCPGCRRTLRAMTPDEEP